MWLPMGFGKSICYEVLPFLFDCKLGKSESRIVVVVSLLVSLMVDQVATLRSHGVSAAVMSGHRYGWVGHHLSQPPHIGARRFEYAILGSSLLL